MVEHQTQWNSDYVDHLRGLTLQRRLYHAPSATWDHDHCAVCSATFADFEGPDVQHEGYATCADYKLGAEYEWVCVRCFNDHKDTMGWSEVAKDP